MNKLFFSATAAALFALLLMAPATWAQDATGQIAGNIKDATGAVISGATVTVTNLGTKTSKQTVGGRERLPTRGIKSTGPPLAR